MEHDRDVDLEHDHHAISRLVDKRVVTIGGGTGPFALLSTLKRYPCSISAIVSMADSGGSSRRLMDEFGVLPLGDLRQALVALSRKGALWRDVFTFRFRPSLKQGGGQPSQSHTSEVAQAAGVAGHSLGNLIISALQEIEGGNLLQAIEDAQELLDTAGRVWPVTLAHITLCAELADEERICGETNIDTRGMRHLDSTDPLPPIKRIFLQEDASGPIVATDGALRAIRRADLIVIGPGDLYTSVLPNFLVEGIAEAIRASEAQKIYICNLMTKHGETDGYKASDFVRRVHEYLGIHVDRVILHDGSFPAHVVEHYITQQQFPVEPDVEEVRRLVPDVIVDSMLSVQREVLVRHDASRLLRAIFAPPTFTPWRGYQSEPPVGPQQPLRAQSRRRAREANAGVSPASAHSSPKPDLTHDRMEWGG
jgi:uncharacterized cofD-like protein